MLAFSFSLIAFGQSYNIPNGDFENWTSNIVIEPDVYTTSNSLFGLSSANVTRSTDAAFGSYSARLETVTSSNDTIPGILLIGFPGGPQGVSGGIPFNGTPDSISGYAKFNIMPTDIGYFIVAFKKNGAIISQAVKVFIGTQNTFDRFQIPTGLNISNPPDSMVVIISSSNLNPPQIPGSYLFIDSISFMHSADVFPNNNFEDWTTTDYGSNPDYWSSLNNFAFLGFPVMSFQSNDFHGGSSAVKIISDTATLFPPFGTGALDTIAGMVFIGPPDMDRPGIPFFLRPTAMNFYSKCVVPAGSPVYASITLTRWNPSTHSRDEIGSGIYTANSSVSSYTLVTVPINYNSFDSPDTMQISFMGGDLGNGGTILPGAEFYVDDVSLTVQSELIDLGDVLNDIVIFPNPVSDKLYINLNSEESKIITIYNSNGAKVLSHNISKNGSEIDFSMFDNGIYFYNIYTDDGVFLKSGKLIKE